MKTSLKQTIFLRTRVDRYHGGDGKRRIRAKHSGEFTRFLRGEDSAGARQELLQLPHDIADERLAWIARTAWRRAASAERPSYRAMPLRVCF